MQEAKRWVAFLLIVGLILWVPSVRVAADGEIITNPTGYTKALDVTYKKVGNYVANWGARGEDCVFLSSYATAYYVGNYTYEVLSGYAGGNSQSDAHTSDLYSALRNMMTSKHTHITEYQETRPLYCYTDCLKNDTSHISSFYSGKSLNGAWDSGKTWNREHTWPNSKGLGGSDEDDIMMLRPTAKSENYSRGNSAYGEGAGYFDPGESVRGDCARIALYVYVRWGNTGYMWGTGGMIQNVETLLRWMEEDPVDTWEMGRNDAVQSITGVRNVFVDYPEYAWMLFGEEVPSSLVTPSGEAKNAEAVCSHTATEIREAAVADCVSAGYTGDTYCKMCGEKLGTGTVIVATGHKNENGDNRCDVCGGSVTCGHAQTEIRAVKAADCTNEGYTGDTYCVLCEGKVSSGETLPLLDHEDKDDDAYCDRCLQLVGCLHWQTELRGIKHPTCAEEGYTGDEYCKNCGEIAESGTVIPVNDKHSYGQWEIVKEATASEEGSRKHTCVTCGHEEAESIPMAEKPADEMAPWVILLGGSMAGTAGYSYYRRKRKQKER